ncbi:alginate lyase [Adhaeribacter aerolatus]|uniref:Alginate lyase n=1 Tax=Adhaeribacter aerolatus TaxID=670289 RepID=A0A512B126_9BACT|nr:alginate lyase family protein [Adhaeribacter aerolatus]GEO05659.1 alginate lyase [Adhaeribacter aerolatus]
MLFPKRFTLVRWLILFLFAFTIPAAAFPQPTQKPRLFILEPAALELAAKKLKAGDAATTQAYRKLIAEANKALQSGPFTVMHKQTLPPSQDKHDYMSVGPYWWPDPQKADGLPYIRRDGEVNPDRYKNGDNDELKKMQEAVLSLAYAYYFSQNEKYATHAASLIRTWFLDEATRMNPNLNFGQAIPGITKGRGIGIIDTHHLPYLVDAVGLLAGAKAWTRADQQGLEKWFGEFLVWLQKSPLGIDEADEHNNHGTWYDVQLASFALFSGNKPLAKKVLEEVKIKRIATQMKLDGSQPHELARTLSFNYSVMNLQAFFDLASLGQHVGVDLWQYTTPDGKGIRPALDYFLPFLNGEKKWPHKQIKEINYSALLPLLLEATRQYQNPRYAAAITKIPEAAMGGSVAFLLTPAN